MSAFDEGLEAFNNNQNINTNPYSSDTQECADWFLGWWYIPLRHRDFDTDYLEYLDSIPDYNDELLDTDPFEFLPVKKS
jgi:hypothetical protein